MKTVNKTAKAARIKKLETKLTNMNERFQTSTKNLKARIQKLKAA